jgi:hypothetical protein
MNEKEVNRLENRVLELTLQVRGLYRLHGFFSSLATVALANGLRVSAVQKT